jgi:uncharacterized protein YecT (DUF1311 family)
MVTRNKLHASSLCGLLLAAVMPICSFSIAQERFNPDTINCDGWRQLGLDNMGETVCAMRDASAARKKLAQLLEELRNKFASEAKKFGTNEAMQWERLAQSQKIWEAFVEKDCEWETGFLEGGSMQPKIEALCIADNTTQRVEHLRNFLCWGEQNSKECPRSRAYAK